jgi:hypothetical protein
MKIPSFPKVFNLGHSNITDLFMDDVIVEEKIDGSQFSFGRIDGKLECKSHHATVYFEDNTSMFKEAVETVKKLEDTLNPNWIYRCEYLRKPKHNVIMYDRIPKDCLILFDINVIEKPEVYISYEDKKREAERLGLECVPLLSQGKYQGYDEFVKLLENISILGGATIEGVVIKNYNRFGRDKKVLMGKYVSQHFKEVMRSGNKKRNPSGKDVIQLLIEELKTVARWNKAIQHLKEKNELVNEPKDIGKLIGEIADDVEAEQIDYIKDKLWHWAKKDIKRGVIAGFPEYYKEKLAKKQFGE